MNRCVLLVIILFSFKGICVPISVKFGIVDTLYKQDCSPCGEYKETLAAAINYALGENSKQLTQCGYKIDYIPQYFDIKDTLSAKEAGENLSYKDVWFILGPRRSDLFLLTIKDLKNTPAISLMAGSKKVTEKNPPIFTMYPSTKKIAKVALAVVMNENIGKKYGSFVDATCSSCKDFDEEFEIISKKILIKKFTLDGSGSEPSLNQLIKKLEKEPIDFLLLPNYSKFSGFVISKIHNLYPNIKFLGSDGWGEEDYSFIPDYNLPLDVVGYSVRLGMPSDKLADLYEVYSLDREWNGKVIKPSVLTFSTIDFIRKITYSLCQRKPKNKKDFFDYLSSQEKNFFQPKIRLSAYKLRDHKVKFYNLY